LWNLLQQNACDITEITGKTVSGVFSKDILTAGDERVDDRHGVVKKWGRKGEAWREADEKKQKESKRGERQTEEKYQTGLLRKTKHN